ncbi:MAG: hypothetical protein AB1582_12080 [Pseudomonadota bacterium]
MTSDLLAERDLYAAHLERLRGKRPHDEVLAYSRSFRKLIDTSADFVGEDLQAGHEGLARSIRDVIETTTVVPAPAGQPPMIRLKGHPESLLGEPSFFDRSSAGGVMVARERYTADPTPCDPLFSITYAGA